MSKKIAEGVKVWVSEKVTYYGVIDVEYDGDFLTDSDVRKAVSKIDEENKEFFEPVDGENFKLEEYGYDDAESKRLKSGQRVQIFDLPVWREWSLGKATLIKKATPEEYNHQTKDACYDAQYWLDLGCELWWVTNIDAFDRPDIKYIVAIKP